MRDKFKEWCNTQDFKKQIGRNITHTFMNGGTLYVPIEHHDIFYEKYAEFIRTTETSLVERKTMPLFRLALDLDILDEEEWSKERIEEFVCFIQTIIHDFYKQNFSCIICAAENTIKKNNLIKTGVHLHWPQLIIDMTKTEILYCAILKKCEEEYGPRPEYNSWPQLVDACVTKDIGLRPPGSAKFEQGVNKGRKYWPIQVINSAGVRRPVHLNTLKNNYACLVKQTSIRCWQNKPLVEFATIPDYAKEFEKEHSVTRITTGKISKKVYNGNGQWKAVIDEKDIEFIQKCFYTIVPERYKNSRIKEILYLDGTYLITITESMSSNNYCTYCQNVNRKHMKNKENQRTVIYAHIELVVVFYRHLYCCFCHRSVP